MEEIYNEIFEFKIGDSVYFFKNNLFGFIRMKVKKTEFHDSWIEDLNGFKSDWVLSKDLKSKKMVLIEKKDFYPDNENESFDDYSTYFLSRKIKFYERKI